LYFTIKRVNIFSRDLAAALGLNFKTAQTKNHEYHYPDDHYFYYFFHRHPQYPIVSNFSTRKQEDYRSEGFLFQKIILY